MQVCLIIPSIAIIMPWIFSQTFTKTPHSSPVGIRYGMSFVNLASNWYFAPVPVIIHVLSYNIEPCYNSTRLYFLAATKQLYDWFSPSVCLSVRLSVRLSHLFHHVSIIVSSWNFQELLPMTKVTSMQKIKVRGQRSRSQRSTPNLTVSGL